MEDGKMEGDEFSIKRKMGRCDGFSGFYVEDDCFGEPTCCEIMNQKATKEWEEQILERWKMEGIFEEDGRLGFHRWIIKEYERWVLGGYEMIIRIGLCKRV